ncbi:MAG: hypothetical protein IJR20_05355 [Muribaculaceae bacterium]|nr:hypothetical protein [Muribaculaceae bacterium]
MKTYLLDTVKRIKRFSQSLDVSTILCNKPWVVFNNTGAKELYIFDRDKTVLMINNGVGVRKTWNWVSANNSLTINMENDTVIMLHPEFVNDTVLALNLDGTQKYSFLIDEKNRQNFKPQTLSELQQYFEDIERKAIETKERKRLKEEKKREEKKLEKKAKEILATANFVKSFIFCLAIISIIFTLSYTASQKPLFAFIFLFVSILLLFAGAYIPIIKSHKYKKEHPNDPVNQYLI